MDDDSSKIVSQPYPTPYFAAVFSWIGAGDAERRESFVAEIFRVAARTPGFLGGERVREVLSDTAAGITIFYWSRRSALDAWSAEVEQHVRESFRDGVQSDIYADWILRVAEVQEVRRMRQVRPVAGAGAEDLP